MQQQHESLLRCVCVSARPREFDIFVNLQCVCVHYTLCTDRRLVITTLHWPVNLWLISPNIICLHCLLLVFCLLRLYFLLSIGIALTNCLVRLHSTFCPCVNSFSADSISRPLPQYVLIGGVFDVPPFVPSHIHDGHICWTSLLGQYTWYTNELHVQSVPIFRGLLCVCVHVYGPLLLCHVHNCSTCAGRLVSHCASERVSVSIGEHYRPEHVLQAVCCSQCSPSPIALFTVNVPLCSGAHWVVSIL